MQYTHYLHIIDALETFTEDFVIWADIHSESYCIEDVKHRINTYLVLFGDPGDEYNCKQLFYTMIDYHSQTVVRVLSDYMGEFYDGNQERVDRRLAPTPGLISLYNVMIEYINVYGRLYSNSFAYFERGIADICDKWIKQIYIWYPRINDASETAFKNDIDRFKETLVTKEAYKRAVKEGLITEPFTWNDSIADLSMWLSDIIPKDSIEGKTRYLWRYADNVFLKDDLPISKQQLKNAYHHL